MPKEVTFESVGWRAKLRAFLKKMGEPVHVKEAARRRRRNRTTSLPTPITKIQSQGKEKAIKSLGNIPLTIKISEDGDTFGNIVQRDCDEKSTSNTSNISLKNELLDISQTLTEAIKKSPYKAALARSVLLTSVPPYLPKTDTNVTIMRSTSLTNLLRRSYPEDSDFKEIIFKYGAPSDQSAKYQASQFEDAHNVNLDTYKINKDIIENYRSVIEELKHIFKDLRALHFDRHWNTKIQKSIILFSKLWEIHSANKKNFEKNFELQRKFIGIGSKIGHLYVQHYLRASEVDYLKNAFALYFFYHSKKYTDYLQTDSPRKITNFYLRYILVCLLLNYHEHAKTLVYELEQAIQQFDHRERFKWIQDLKDVKALVHIVPTVFIVNEKTKNDYRLHPNMIPAAIQPSQNSLSLREVVIVGCRTHNVNEISLDMIRMIQALEREWLQCGYEDNASAGHPNPRRHVLYKPSPSQVLHYMAEASSVMPRNSVILLYISADGLAANPLAYPDQAGYEFGGVLMTSKAAIKKPTKDSQWKEVQCFYPGDLVPFTRRPLFIVVDSDNSYAFETITSQFGEPLIIIMSPKAFPSGFHDRNKIGGLFTMFLHSPLDAFCLLCDLDRILDQNWKQGQVYLSMFHSEALRLLTTDRDGEMYMKFMEDDILRLLLLRFIFSEVTLRMHKAFRIYPHLPRAFPPIPVDIIDHPSLSSIILQLASHFKVCKYFRNPSEVDVVVEVHPPPNM